MGVSLLSVSKIVELFVLKIAYVANVADSNHSLGADNRFLGFTPRDHPLYFSYQCFVRSFNTSSSYANLY